MTAALLPNKMIVSALPKILPVFPLSGAILLPYARLPLTIFEPRYLAMIEDALGQGRMIGMIQPSVAGDVDHPPLYSVGCAGRITSFAETDDGHFLIVLTGICRFHVKEEKKKTGLYRSVIPDWQSYLADLDEPEDSETNREHLLDLIDGYFKKHAISVEWDLIKNASDEVLISTVAMICPFATNEKQALLEAETTEDRAKMLVTLLEMAALPQGENEADIKH